jgi:hypothetical protein
VLFRSYGQGAPIEEIKSSIRLEMDLIRNKWSDMFSAYGRLLEPKQLEQFKTAFKSKISDFVDSGAKIFNDQTIGKLKIYPASRPVMNEITNEIYYNDQEFYKLPIIENQLILESCDLIINRINNFKQDYQFYVFINKNLCQKKKFDEKKLFNKATKIFSEDNFVLYLITR